MTDPLLAASEIARLSLCRAALEDRLATARSLKWGAAPEAHERAGPMGSSS